MTVRLLITAGAAVVTAIALSGGAGATPPEGDTVRVDLANGTTEGPVTIDTTGPSTLVVQELTISPGAGSGWHTHPGPEYSVINDGVVQLQTALACSPVDYAAGQAVFIPAGVPHRVANESGHDVEVVVTYTLPVGSAVRGDSPDVCAGG
jgi:quercetin dioxygenase-like cupin family protein